METAINAALPVVMAAVLIVLVLGVVSLLRANPGGGPSRSNRLMRMRVALQLVAVVILALGFYWKSRHGG